MRNKTRSKAPRGRGVSALRRDPEPPAARGQRGGRRPSVRRSSTGAAAAPLALVPTRVVIEPGVVLGSLASEEETIESSKCVPARPARVFEEERFQFPETYGTSRIRLLVKDPDWLFVYWDVNARSLQQLRESCGQRVVALARVTLRITDPRAGGGMTILVPAGARSWYVRTDETQRAYRAELGLTLPSGEFRLLAASNTAIMPRRGPSAERARRTFNWATSQPGVPVPGAGSSPAPRGEAPNAGTPWQPSESLSAPEGPGNVSGRSRTRTPAEELGGSSELSSLGGASDVHSRH